MRNIKLFKTGFTLIELLVVIAIIGVMSSIVLSSLSNSRKKANDARIKSQLSHIRSSAEVYYNGPGNNSYGTALLNGCNVNVFSDSAVTSQLSSLPGNPTPTCRSSPAGYAVSVVLSSVSGYWCVDYKGSSKLITVNLPSLDITCN